MKSWFGRAKDAITFLALCAVGVVVAAYVVAALAVGVLEKSPQAGIEFANLGVQSVIDFVVPEALAGKRNRDKGHRDRDHKRDRDKKHGNNGGHHGGQNGNNHDGGKDWGNKDHKKDWGKPHHKKWKERKPPPKDNCPPKKPPPKKPPKKPPPPKRDRDRSCECGPGYHYGGGFCRDRWNNIVNRQPRNCTRPPVQLYTPRPNYGPGYG